MSQTIMKFDIDLRIRLYFTVVPFDKLAESIHHFFMEGAKKVSIKKNACYELFTVEAVYNTASSRRCIWSASSSSGVWTTFESWAVSVDVKDVNDV